MVEPSERLTDAVIDLLVAEGFEGVSVRRVATAAGVSIGAVQHHFPTKAAMLDAAMRRASDQFTARLQQRLSTADPPDQLLRMVTGALVGVGAEERRVSVIWLQRLARAAVDPDVARGHAEDWQQLEQLLVELLTYCRPDRDADWCRERAAALLALLDGLAATVVTEPKRMPAERARRIADVELERLLEDG